MTDRGLGYQRDVKDVCGLFLHFWQERRVGVHGERYR